MVLVHKRFLALHPLLITISTWLGGVDVADLRRKRCNSSTIMGLNRWWLKLFYLLDVGTANALVLYNQQLKIRAEGKDFKPMNIFDFKMQLVKDLAGKYIYDIVQSTFDATHMHTPIYIPDGGRWRCVYSCAYTTSTEESKVRTLRICAICGVPLCVVGSGKAHRDCFTLAHHKSEDMRRRVCKHF